MTSVLQQVELISHTRINNNPVNGCWQFETNFQCFASKCSHVEPPLTSILGVVSSCYRILTDRRSEVQRLDTERFQIAHNPDMFHLILLIEINRPGGELVSKQEAKSRISIHPRRRSRGQQFRKASSKSRSLSSDDHVQPVIHAHSKKLSPRPSSPPPLQYIHYFSARTCSKTADRSKCLRASSSSSTNNNNNTTTTTTSSSSSSATSSAATNQICTRSLGHTSADVGATSTDTAVETLRRKLQGGSNANRQQQATPEKITSLPSPPPPPPTIPIPTAPAAQLTPLTHQPTALTNVSQQYSSGVLVSSYTQQQFLPQRLGGSQQGIPRLQQTDST